MHRLLIAAAAAGFLAASVGPALADDYPPCTSPTQDHCRVVPMHHHMGHHHMAHHHMAHHHMARHHAEHHHHHVTHHHHQAKPEQKPS